ncbi:MAG: type II CRISPR RNA-guided endonuclease Cas9 [Deltaproteobacteria bacterium]|nr:type II CRISPR RNA-guided endonuclease Cas9 [Deltaproteobacteria bacterium]
MKNTVSTLGLDIGTNSIGWALVEHNNSREPSGLTACGSRIFSEAVDPKTNIPKNQARRAARSARKLVARRKMRRNKVLNLLTGNGLLPEDAIERQRLFTDKSFDPYRLRKISLNDKLSPHELGRALFHLSQRRGFQSSRKTSSKDEGMIKSAISSLRQEMTDTKSRTLGEFLAERPKKRNRFTDRAMYQEEFELIWRTQQKYHPELLNSALKVAVHNGIFFQRPLKLQKNLVGRCTFEPGRKRAARALLETQRFRILQDLNHLAVKNPLTRVFRSLTGAERQKLLELLEKQKNLSWNKARSALKLHEGEVFNLEEGKKKELIGNRTEYALRSVLGEHWDKISSKERNSLITDMLTIDNEKGFLKRMTEHWGFDAEKAEKLAKTELEPGYARLSFKAINKVLPYLEEGLTYDKACLAAGYDHSNNNEITTSKSLGEPPSLRNPVVQKALYETRRVVNGIIRQYGRPAVIRIEMARDMKLTRRQKTELQKEQKNREKANELARGILQNEFGIQNPSRDDIQKYQMWNECGNICPYTGTVISKEMLFSPEVDIEHILPYSRSLDDSYMNKTLCTAAENRSIKHNRTPYEAYNADGEKYQAILQRAKALPHPKRRRFEQKEIDTDKFVERQLNDTRYICVEVKRYLQQTGATIEVSKGAATAALRRRWNLNKILSADGSGEKNRSDHRHHAIDATVIALTSRSLFQKLSRLSAETGASLSERGFHLDKPWPSFYDDVRGKIEGIIVSHASRRKITDAFHQDTAYGYINGNGCFAYRKPLADLRTLSMVEDIGDYKVRELVNKRLNEFNGDFKKAFGNPENPLLHLDGKTPIKSVRLHVKANEASMHPVKKDGKAYKYFKLENNHHVEIIENVTTGKREGRFVPTIDAARRARIDKKTIVKRDHGPEWKFIMSLCINDMVEITDKDGGKRYYRVKEMSGPINRIVLRDHLVTATSDNAGILRCTPNSLPSSCRKISVDCLGDVMPCND